MKIMLRTSHLERTGIFCNILLTTVTLTHHILTANAYLNPEPASSPVAFKGGEENREKFFVGRAKNPTMHCPALSQPLIYINYTVRTVFNEGPAEEAGKALPLFEMRNTKVYKLCMTVFSTFYDIL